MVTCLVTRLHGYTEEFVHCVLRPRKRNWLFIGTSVVNEHDLTVLIKKKFRIFRKQSLDDVSHTGINKKSITTPSQKRNIEENLDIASPANAHSPSMTNVTDRYQDVKFTMEWNTSSSCPKTKQKSFACARAGSPKIKENRK